MEPRKPAAWDAVSVGDEIQALVRTTDLASWNRYAALNDEFISLQTDADY